MNNFYTLRFLVSEFKDNVRNCVFDNAVSFQKNRIDLYFLAENSSVKLSAFTGSAQPAMFMVSPQPHKKRNFASFFSSLQGQSVTDITLANSDRLLYFHFTNTSSLLFQLFGSVPNVFLVHNGVIKESFKRNESYSGTQAPEPRSPNPQEASWSGKVRSFMLSINPALPRTFLNDIIFQHNLEEKNPNEIEKFTHELSEALSTNATAHLVHDKSLCTIPESYLDIERPYKYDNFNHAVRESFFSSNERLKFRQKYNQISKLLEKELKRLNARKTQLSKAEKGLERSDQYEQFGHLIMANLYNPPKQDETVFEVQDFYDQSQKVRIPVKPGVPLTEMADTYYQKSRDAKKAYEVAISMKEETASRLKEIQRVQDRFEKITELPELQTFETEEKELLNSLNASGGSKADDAVNFIRKEYSGYEILIGRNATNNDELLRYAHKEDIWLHARGVGGSHVIIRMNNNKNFPDKSVIIFAAGHAAGYSKSAGSSLAPVMFTKRKHVRKPKGADRGKVIATKEDVIMVEPVKKQSQ